MTEFTFPKYGELPKFEVETAIGAVTVRPRPLEWDEAFELMFTQAYDQMDFQFYRPDDDPKRGGKDVAVQRYLIRPREDFKAGKGFSLDFYNSAEELIGGRAVTYINLELRKGKLGSAVICEQYRGLGIMPAVTGELIPKLREMGFHTLFTYIHEKNTASQRQISKVGFKRGERNKGDKGARAHFIWRLNLLA